MAINMSAFVLLTFTEIISFLNKLTLLMMTAVFCVAFSIFLGLRNVRHIAFSSKNYW